MRRVRELAPELRVSNLRQTLGPTRQTATHAMKRRFVSPVSPNDTRRLAAILAADVVGFSSMMESDEEGTL